MAPVDEQPAGEPPATDAAPWPSAPPAAWVWIVVVGLVVAVVVAVVLGLGG